MSFKAFYLSAEGDFKRGLNEDEIRTAYQSGKGLLWVDISETTEQDGEFLARNFNFHHLAIEDCVSPSIHQPKIDDFGDYLFIIVHGIKHNGESPIVETTEFEFFLGHNCLVTNHNDPIYSVDSIIKIVEEDGRPMRRGADFLAYTLIDALIDHVFPTIDKMSEFADQIEQEVIRNPQQSTLEAIMMLKRSVIRLHRVMAPQREVLNRLSRPEFPIIGDDAHIFYRDIYDHIVLIEDLGQSLRDRADHVLAIHLSAVAYRQNEYMRILSLMATIFLPLALVAGIYGMNFEYMPELSWHWGYFAVIGFVGFVIISVISWFWFRRWIMWGRGQVVRVRPFAVERDKLTGYLEHVINPHQKKR